MKNVIKVLIAVFIVLSLGLTGILIYALTGGRSGQPPADGNGWAFRQNQLIHSQTLTLADVSGISVKTASSDIIFLAGDGNEIVINEYCSEPLKDSFITVVKENGELSIQSNDRNINPWKLFGYTYRYIEIHLPRSYQGAMVIESVSGDITSMMDLILSECTISSTSGDITVEQISGEQNITSNSGDIDIIASSGNLNLTTTAGDITVAAMEGQLTVKTISGDVFAGGLEGFASAKTTAGDIELQISALTGDLIVDTISGSVWCELPADAGFAFKATTTSGDIETDFNDLLRFDKDGRQAQGTAGLTAGQQVEVKTTSGDIDITWR